MRYITYAVITVLMFGMAFAPSIHDGWVFAQTSEIDQTSMEKKEMMQEQKRISVEKKQVLQDKKEMTIEKKKISKEKQSTNFEESKSRLLERYSTMSNEQIFQLHERLQYIREVNDAMKEKLDAGVTLRLSLNESEREKVYQAQKEQRLSDRLFQLHQTPEQRADKLQELKNDVMVRKNTSISPYVQVTLGSDLTEVICPLDKYLVIRNSNEMPNCMSYYTATTLINRGIVSYPE